LGLLGWREKKVAALAA